MIERIVGNVALLFQQRWREKREKTVKVVNLFCVKDNRVRNEIQKKERL